MSNINNVSKVPFIDITRYEENFLEKVTNSTSELLRLGRFVGGEAVSQFEKDIQLYTQSSFAVGCANGTDALQLALRATGIKREDKVLVPDMTFWATFESVVNVGATPVTLDVSRETLHLTLSGVKDAVEKYNPKALILVHLYGWACPETLEIRNYCDEKGVILIEDCAQAIGTKINNMSLIGSAKVATTSFYPAKVLGASGDAGAVFTSDEETSKKVRVLANHGRTHHYEHGLVGWNSRLGSYEANFLLHSLKHLDQKLESRRKVCQRYRQEISNPDIQFLSSSENVWENGYLSVALMEPSLRVRFIDDLKSHNIGYGTVYPGAMSLQSGAQDYLGGKIDHGHALWISQAVINLPCFAYMNDEEIDYVIEKVNAFKA